ncbi:hypothetical protein SAMN04487785_101477 [Dyella jiangningensis]|uniref:hypothetical protein n=1 Tax=Dyella sp. AtDHG13 TaxID=1938897 RepID=UPI0008800926|nr:hypothetical protein [Dyella sp. AtDHG13]PXV59564.1 hypothetical protein BDW41_10394 [Dyella sp. AtDHG13]SDJ32081.1 hypothetical protein SAMN04487785_101477 [Dyella jiangningensis]
MKRWCWGLLLLLVMSAAQAASGEKAASVSGPADRDIPAWTVRTDVPDGWTQDCCMYAKAIGVNLVLYKGEWTGEPDRVMVLNVWPSKLSSLEAEMQEDRHHYLDRDAKGKVSDFVLDNKGMPCRGVLYEGADRKDDAVVFCDPGLATGIRLSWSMTLAHDDAQKQELLALFRHVSEQTRYLKQESAKSGVAKAQH